MRAEPSEQKVTVSGDQNQRIPNTTAKAHTGLSPETRGVEDKQPTPQPTPSAEKTKHENTEPDPLAQR